MKALNSPSEENAEGVWQLGGHCMYAPVASSSRTTFCFVFFSFHFFFSDLCSSVEFSSLFALKFSVTVLFFQVWVAFFLLYRSTGYRPKANMYTLDPHALYSPVAGSRAFLACTVAFRFCFCLIVFFSPVFVRVSTLFFLSLTCNFILLSFCSCQGFALWCCCFCSMLLLNLQAHTGCALSGVAAASGCYTTCVCCMILLRLLLFVVGLPLHAVIEFTRT